VLGFWRMAQPFKALGDAVAGQHRFVASLKQSKRVWEEFGWDLPPDGAEQLNQAWQRLPAWPDSVDGLLLLKQHYLIGPLSNGDTALLVRMAKHAGLPWDVVIGTDVTRQYKPHPDAYTRAAAILDLRPRR